LVGSQSAAASTSCKHFLFIYWIMSSLPVYITYIIYIYIMLNCIYMHSRHHFFLTPGLSQITYFCFHQYSAAADTMNDWLGCLQSVFSDRIINRGLQLPCMGHLVPCDFCLCGMLEDKRVW
jgi:hypothetical protein